MKNITKDYLLTHIFEKTGLEPQTETRVKVSGMFSAAALASLPRSDDKKLEDLNIRLSNLTQTSHKEFSRKPLFLLAPPV